jgi:lysozyme
MVSSVLSPEKIVGRQNTNRTAAQNFISGGSILGASVVNGAANKIVGFQRAGVQPADPVVNNIVSTITTNINNNVTNVINKTLQGFSTDYQRRLKQVDDTKPIGVLGKFLNVYKTALGFINFFGNKKNIDKVRDNLEALKKSFTESFEVAKLIRQVIIKIVKQLSNLPVASPSGGGGLNLDVDIPGGGLKKTAPRGLGRMMGGGKGKMLALGAGALGLGVAGGATVNALSDSPQAQARAAETSPEIPGDIADRFSSIVDRFANAVSKLFENKKQKPKQESSGSSGSSGGGTKASPAPGSLPSAGSMPSMGEGSQGPAGESTRSLLDTIAYAEGTSKYDNQGYNTHFGGSQTSDLSKHPDKVISSGGYSSAAFGRYQFMPGTWNSVGGGSMTPERQDAGAVRLTIKRLNQAGIKVKDENELETLLQKEGLSPRIAAALSPEWASFPTATGKSYYGQPVKKLENIQNVYKERLKKQSQGTAKPSAPSKKGGMGGPTVDVSMISPETRKALGIQISQPPPSQQQQQPVVMPIDLSGGGQQQTGGGGGGTSGPPPSKGNGPSVPFLPASNTDNFLVLYSRMVYNIVDG